MSDYVIDALEKRNEDFDSSIIEFIGMALYDEDGQIIFGVDKEGGYQRLLDVRAWGAIQNYFMTKKGEFYGQKAVDFQDEIGRFVAFAINEKIKEIKNV